MPPAAHDEVGGRKNAAQTAHGHDSAQAASGVNNAARQAGTALGVAIFGVVAGSQARADHFISALRWLGVASAIGWLVVAALIYSVARAPAAER